MSKDAGMQLQGRSLCQGVNKRGARRPASGLGRPRPAPRRLYVVPIYWDPHFRKTPADVAAFDEFLRTLFQSSWMTGLGQDGAPLACLLPSVVPSESAPRRLTQAELEGRLAVWLRPEETPHPEPLQADQSRLYLIVTPPGTDLASAPLGARANSREPCVLIPLASTGGDVLDLHALRISQELARAFRVRARRQSRETRRARR